jgi:hypothetical protein
MESMLTPTAMASQLADLNWPSLLTLKPHTFFDNLNYLLERHVYFIETYHDGELLVFRGRKTHKWLTQWLAKFQQGVDRLL